MFMAADAMEGTYTLRKEQIDVVLVDCQMPEITGVEFTLQVRKGGEIPNPEIPIIMISGYTHDAKLLSASQAGIHEFVSKSFSFNSFFRRIETTFNPSTSIHPQRRLRPPRPSLAQHKHTDRSRTAKCGRRQGRTVGGPRRVHPRARLVPTCVELLRPD